MKLNIYTDGGSRGNPGPGGTGIWVGDDQGRQVYSQGHYLGVTTNNQAEYQAFLKSLQWLIEQPFTKTLTSVDWHLDSKLVVEQLNRRWKIKDADLAKIAVTIFDLLEKLSIPYRITHVPRSQNSRADGLVNQALDQHA